MATKEISQVCASCVGGGTSTDLFTYATNPHGPPPSVNYNYWLYKAVQTLPDSSQIITYTNAYGMQMLQVTVDPSGTNKWCTFYRYDSNGRAIWQAQPSAVNGYSESDDDLMGFSGGSYTYLNNSTGLILVSDYYSSGAVGYIQNQKVRQGQSGSDILVRSYTYTSNTDSGGNTIYLVATQVDYPDASTTATTVRGARWSGGGTCHFGRRQLHMSMSDKPQIAPNGLRQTRVINFGTRGRITKTDLIAPRTSADLLPPASIELSHRGCVSPQNNRGLDQSHVSRIVCAKVA
ncbi:MAG TPA: hypothetical protein VHI52_18765 [Verrucomicrobiae bacterium]|nr:hypothetical protein [Verrucomicrobiae bacterium]